MGRPAGRTLRSAVATTVSSPPLAQSSSESFRRISHGGCTNNCTSALPRPPLTPSHKMATARLSLNHSVTALSKVRSVKVAPRAEQVSARSPWRALFHPRSCLCFSADRMALASSAQLTGSATIWTCCLSSNFSHRAPMRTRRFCRTEGGAGMVCSFVCLFYMPILGGMAVTTNFTEYKLLRSLYILNSITYLLSES